MLTSIPIGLIFVGMSRMGTDREDVDADLWTKLDTIGPEDNPGEYKRILDLIQRRREAREKSTASFFPLVMGSWAAGLLLIVVGGTLMSKAGSHKGQRLYRQPF